MPGDALGDSLYEAVIYVRGNDHIARRRRAAEEPMTATPTSPRVSDVARRTPASHSTRANSSASHRPHALSLECRRESGVLMDTSRYRCLCQNRLASARRAGATTATSIDYIQQRRRARAVRDPRPGRQAQAAALRRSAVPRRVAVALSARGLSREMQHARRCSARASRRSRSSSTSRSPSPA